MDGLDMRDQLTIKERMHGKAGRLGGDLDFLNTELEKSLDVCAGNREDVPFPDLAGEGPVHVARDDSAHLRMSLDDLPESPSIGRGQTNLVKSRDPGLNRRVMQGN